MANNFILRTLSGIILCAIVIGAILLSEITMLALAMIITGFSMYEFFAIGTDREGKPVVWYTTLIALAIVLLFYLVATNVIDLVFLILIIPACSTFFIIELFRNKPNPFFNIAIAICSLAYIALPMGLFVYMPFFHSGSYQNALLLSVIGLVWANDVGAYLVGISIGRHKMFERLSPKKSWEGFGGGVFFTVATACTIATLFDYNIYIWTGLGLIVSIFSVLGDLVESMLKRSLNIKDSGSLIPGHGGFLDRFDALLLTLPFIFIYFIIFTFK